jgi:hypothetical protein
MAATLGPLNVTGLGRFQSGTHPVVDKRKIDLRHCTHDLKHETSIAGVGGKRQDGRSVPTDRRPPDAEARALLPGLSAESPHTSRRSRPRLTGGNTSETSSLNL